MIDLDPHTVNTFIFGFVVATVIHFVSNTQAKFEKEMEQVKKAKSLIIGDLVYGIPVEEVKVEKGTTVFILNDCGIRDRFEMKSEEIIAFEKPDIERQKMEFDFLKVPLQTLYEMAGITEFERVRDFNARVVGDSLEILFRTWKSERVFGSLKVGQSIESKVSGIEYKVTHNDKKVVVFKSSFGIHRANPDDRLEDFFAGDFDE
jgi:hypothetical protein